MKLEYAPDLNGLQIQLGLAWLALAALGSEINDQMRQSALLDMLAVQRENINAASREPEF